MDKNDIPAPAAQPELFTESDAFYWQRPRRRRVSLATSKYRRSGAAWWFRQMHVAADQPSSDQPSPD